MGLKASSRTPGGSLRSGERATNAARLPSPCDLYKGISTGLDVVAALSCAAGPAGRSRVPPCKLLLTSEIVSMAPGVSRLSAVTQAARANAPPDTMYLAYECRGMLTTVERKTPGLGAPRRSWRHLACRMSAHSPIQGRRQTVLAVPSATSCHAGPYLKTSAPVFDDRGSSRNLKPIAHWGSARARQTCSDMTVIRRGR